MLETIVSIGRSALTNVLGEPSIPVSRIVAMALMIVVVVHIHLIVVVETKIGIVGILIVLAWILKEIVSFAIELAISKIVPWTERYVSWAHFLLERVFWAKGVVYAWIKKKLPC